MRADAQKNYDHLLQVGREVITEEGADASMRDVARRAGVGIATLYRHFPTKEALLDALLRESFDGLTARAVELETASEADKALIAWLRDIVALTHNYRGVLSSMTAAIAEPESALHASCVSMKGSGTRLLERAQAEGKARRDFDGADLFALVSALAWLQEQPAHATRAEHLFDVMTGAILTTG